MEPYQVEFIDEWSKWCFKCLHKDNPFRCVKCSASRFDLLIVAKHPSNYEATP